MDNKLAMCCVICSCNAHEIGYLGRPLPLPTLGRGNDLAVESISRNPGGGVRFLVSAAAGRCSSALSTLNYCVVLPRWCCAVPG